VAVLSHDPKLDDPALFGALQSDARFIGAIGSPKTQRERRERLAAAGITEAQLARLHGPIGLDIGAQSPEEIGVAILAQIIAAKSGKLSAAPERARAAAAAVS
jgi:xanthine dehydrogenase accessory factor